MRTFKTSDGTSLAFQDLGQGPAIVFSHGWPLASDAWESQLLFFAQQGFRAIAHDRRGHGASGRTWKGNTIDQYADDLSELIEALDLKDIVMVGHSTGGGEVARYIGRHGTGRVGKVAMVGAVPPLMLKTDANPNGTPLEVFDNIRRGTALNRSQFFKDLTMPFYGFNREGAAGNDGLRESFWLMGMRGDIQGHYDCIHEFSEVDYSDDLRKIDRPTLFIHGDDDQIVPITASAKRAVTIAPQARLLVYPGGSHGLAQVTPEKFNADLLAFIRS